MKSSVSLVLSILIFGVILQSGCNNTTGVEPQRVPVIRFSKTYFPDEPVVDVQPTSDGGFVALSRVSSSGKTDLLLFKTDKDGLLQWSNTFGENNFCSALQIANTSDGGFLILSTKWNTPGNNSQLYVVKTDSRGNKIWAKLFDDRLAGGVARWQSTDDLGFVIAITRLTLTLITEEVLIKISESGEVIWSKILTHGNYDNPKIIEHDKGFLTIFHTSNLVYGDSLLILKTDELGNVISIHSYNISMKVLDIHSAKSGGFLCTTCLYTDTSFSKTGLLKINTDGEVEWTKIFPHELSLLPNGIEQTTDDGFLLIANTYIKIRHAMIVKIDNTGQEQWSYIIPCGYTDRLESIKYVHENQYIACGIYRNDTFSPAVAWLLKFDLSACEQWVKKK